MGKKHKVIVKIFEICKSRNDFVFDNELVKSVSKDFGVGNPFDVTKLDTTEKFPQELLDEDYFILHLGQGKHMFVKNVAKGFHKFEPIDEKDVFRWKYRKSVLNEFDTSESNILSVAFNQRIIHDFLYEDIIAGPKMYGARRTKASFEFKMGNKKIETNNVQMEIDLTTEYNGIVTIFEGKNNFPRDFAVYQIYYPFLYYFNLKRENKLPISDINCCYVLRKKEKKDSVIRIYNYTFEKPFSPESIKLVKSAQYNLVKR